MKENAKLNFQSESKPFVPREQRFPYGTRVALSVQLDHQKNMKVTLSEPPWEGETNERN